MSFKSSLNALFRLSGGMAMPSSNQTAVSVTGTQVTFTAPKAGWLYVVGRGVSSQTSSIEVLLNGVSLGVRAIFSADLLGRVFVPLNKGRSVTINLTNIQSDQLIRFIESVGGGILKVYQWNNSLVQGGAICLKTSFTTSSKRYAREFSRLIVNLLCKQSRLVKNLDRTRLPQTAWLKSLAIVHRLKSITKEQEKHIQSQRVTLLIKRVRFLLTKGITSLGCSMVRMVETPICIFITANLKFRNMNVKEVCHA